MAEIKELEVIFKVKVWMTEEELVKHLVDDFKMKIGEELHSPDFVNYKVVNRGGPDNLPIED